MIGRSGRRITLFKAAVATWLLSMGGCEHDFEPASYLDQVQLIGARLAVKGDAARATPHPGDRVEAELVVVGGQRDASRVDVSIMSVQCRYPERFTSNPICQELLDQAEIAPDRISLAYFALDTFENPRLVCRPDNTIWIESTDRQTGLPIDALVGGDYLSALGVTLRCIYGPPILPINVAQERRTGDALLVRGVVCTEGDAMFAPDLPLFLGCQNADTSPAMPFHMRVDVTDRDSDNHNPQEDQVAVWLNGAPWPQGAGDPCAEDGQDGQPLLDPDEHRITVGLTGEAFEETSDGDTEQYALELFSDDGLAAAESPVYLRNGANRAGAQATFQWRGPTDLEDGERRPVRFWLTLRDGRGGFLLLRRHACLQRPLAD